MMRWCDEAYGMKYVALRYFNVAGAKSDASIGEDHDPETHLVPIILQVALGQRQELAIFGDDYDTPGWNLYQRLRTRRRSMQRPHFSIRIFEKGNPSNVFNLGSNNGYSVKEMLDAARTVTQKDIPAKVAPRRAGDPGTLVASSDKAKAVLGWEPSYTDVKQIIETAWNWHVSHPEGYQD